MVLSAIAMIVGGTLPELIRFQSLPPEERAAIVAQKEARTAALREAAEQAKVDAIERSTAAALAATAARAEAYDRCRQRS